MHSPLIFNGFRKNIIFFNSTTILMLKVYKNFILQRPRREQNDVVPREGFRPHEEAMEKFGESRGATVSSITPSSLLDLWLHHPPPLLQS